MYDVRVYHSIDQKLAITCIEKILRLNNDRTASLNFIFITYA